VVVGVVGICIVVWLIIRLSFTTILVARAEGKPYLATSWQLTHRKFWAIWGRYIGFGLLMLVATAVLQGVVASAAASLHGTTNPASIAISQIAYALMQLFFGIYGVAYSITLLRHLQRIRPR